MDDDGEVDVEPHEDSPHVGELVLKWSRFLDQENEVNAKKCPKIILRGCPTRSQNSKSLIILDKIIHRNG